MNITFEYKISMVWEDKGAYGVMERKNRLQIENFIYIERLQFGS